MLNLHSADKQIEITFIPVRTLETAEGKILFCGADVANEVVKHEGSPNHKRVAFTSLSYIKQTLNG